MSTMFLFSHDAITRVSLCFIFFLSAATAFADWKEITKTYQSVGYIDPDSIEKHGDVTSMKVLIDYQKPPFDGNNLSYRSLTLMSEYHCVNKQFRTLLLTSHVGNMATGQKPYHSDEASEWHSIPPTSIQKIFWEKACGK